MQIIESLAIVGFNRFCKYFGCGPDLTNQSDICGAMTKLSVRKTEEKRVNLSWEMVVRKRRFMELKIEFICQGNALSLGCRNPSSGRSAETPRSFVPESSLTSIYLVMHLLNKISRI